MYLFLNKQWELAGYIELQFHFVRKKKNYESYRIIIYRNKANNISSKILQSTKSTKVEIGQKNPIKIVVKIKWDLSKNHIY